MISLAGCIWISLLWWAFQELFTSVNSATGDDTIGAKLYDACKEHV